MAIPLCRCILVPIMGSGNKTNGIDSPQSAIITNIQGFSIHDGPGIRTVVFFKGCPLSCQWCANPECLSGKPQMGFIETLCADCGKCLDACTNNAIQRIEGAHRIDYSHCISCGKCRDQCYYGALVRYGESMSVSEVWDAVRRDKIFYDEFRRRRDSFGRRAVAPAGIRSGTV